MFVDGSAPKSQRPTMSWVANIETEKVILNFRK